MFDRRLLVVAGKGGVGRSTVSAALAVAAAGRGLSTVVAEVAGQADVARTLDGRAADGMGEAELRPGIHHVSITRQAALEEYLRDEVPGPLPAAILARSRLFQAFIDAAPGMSELLTIGKVWELAQRPRHRRGGRQYDLVILDAPASGQLLGLLAAPRTFSAIARVGPVARQGNEIETTLRDRDAVAVIGVSTPEQMAVSETVMLHRSLADRLGQRLAAVVVNRLFAERFSAAEAGALAAAPDDPAIRSARWFQGRTRSQRGQIARLRAELPDVGRATLPYVFAEELTASEIEGLADRLNRSLG